MPRRQCRLGQVKTKAYGSGKKTKTISKVGIQPKQSFQGLGTLLVGMVIGSLATILWQGMQVADGGVGTGIRQMIEQSRLQDRETTIDQEVREADKPVMQQTNFDFFTVLPEIEVVVPSGQPDPPSPAGDNDPAQDPAARETQSAYGSAYMLQAGSYKNKADADRLKAELALKGLVSSIQKVSIQGRGDFFRVRLGPFSSYDEMAVADENVSGQGIKTLRLKISKGG